jgi:hypothetical protein
MAKEILQSLRLHQDDTAPKLIRDRILTPHHLVECAREAFGDRARFAVT